MFVQLCGAIMAAVEGRYRFAARPIREQREGASDSGAGHLSGCSSLNRAIWTARSWGRFPEYDPSWDTLQQCLFIFLRNLNK